MKATDEIIFSKVLSQMHGCIYYVGGNRTSLARSNFISPRIRESTYTPYRGRRECTGEQRNNTTRSTSCPKTERSRYVRSVDQMRTLSPALRQNAMMVRKVFGGALKQNQGKERLTDNKKMSKLSSAFETGQKKEAADGEKVVKIRFKKVEQPRLRPKQVHWKLQNVPLQTNKQVLSQKAKNIPFPMRQSTKQVNSQKLSSVSQVSETTICEHYRIQPERRLFLCTRCYQFTPMIELRSHYMNCNIPLRKEQFVQKWMKLISLLEECYREREKNQLYRLIDRMRWYAAECGVGKKQGYILYSQELSSLLSAKGSIQARGLSEQDLFWLIEALGDLIETKQIEMDETAFWKICT